MLDVLPEELIVVIVACRDNGFTGFILERHRD